MARSASSTRRRHRGSRSGGVRGTLQHAARSRDRPRRAQRTAPRHRIDVDARQGIGRWRQAVAPEGHRPRSRRLFALARLDRRWNRLRPHRRAATPSRSTARPVAPRCAAALSLHAGRESLALFDATSFDAPSTADAADLLADWGSNGPWLVLLSEDEANAGKSFRNIARVDVMPVGDAGVADIVGAASLLVSQTALPELVARANASGSSRRREETCADGSVAGDHPPGRLREDIRARRGRQVHVPRARPRAQDADPPGDRAAVRRQGGRRPHRLGQEQAQAPRVTPPGAAGSGRRRSCRCSRVRPSRSSRACEGSE